MGWFLLRKPYPGLTEAEERITIDSDELYFGRGRDCSVHCLSMYVSRRHLKIIPKESGTVCLLDLGSANGTFVNHNRVTPGEEIALRPGDEISIGVGGVGFPHPFVYVVQQDNSSPPELSDQTRSLLLVLLHHSILSRADCPKAQY